jgi:hypothetical protein
MGAVPPRERPFVTGTFTTPELPPTPQRDYRIAAASWVDAPEELLQLGAGIDEPVEYKRRIGRFLLWRAGPPIGRANYLALSEDLSESYRFELDGKRGFGKGPDGGEHRRFRTWKESLRDASGGGG